MVKSFPLFFINKTKNIYELIKTSSFLLTVDLALFLND